ncbi:hypothetical protein PR202_ga11556 [Eleusine coracana subsp. coracana]|uniref:Uncharacterized protein n=1 Tax=Eleusine coracana subsp. coracana TaxID=191504 RepID=A0AAV5C9X1_ELECO|nr:hypothetical protein PR202_ga11556 [Eleusine coracana subsp. coracana]
MRSVSGGGASSSIIPALLPPGPTGLPFIGSALSFLGPMAHHTPPHRVIARLAATYGPVVFFRPGTSGDFVVVSSPAAAREALVGHGGAALAARFVPDAARARAARRLAERVRARSSGAPVAVGDAVLGAVLDVTSNVLFSQDVAGFTARQMSFKEVVAAVLEDWNAPNVSDAFPFLAPLDLFGTRRRVSGRLARLYDFLDEQFVQPRLLLLDSGEKKKKHGEEDLLDIVLARHAKAELTRSQITRFFTDIFLAAGNTTRITVEWAMAMLLKHPDKMDKVRAELAANIGSKDFVEDSDLGKLPYLHAVVKETLRLHPAAPLLPRAVVADGGISLAGFTVPNGTNVLVNLWAMGRDPAAWTQPDEFVPERFLSGGDGNNSPAAVDFAYRPFGAGQRMCPGMDLAARLVPLLLASFLHRTAWRLPDGLDQVDLTERYSMVLELATPLRAVPVLLAS